jgi:thiol-disulfide isomerase/thioredoxin
MDHTLIFFRISLKSIGCKIHIGSGHLRLRNLTILLALLFSMPNLFSQNTTIVFNAKPNVKIGISKEIDNTFVGTLTDEISTDDTGSCIYSWDVDNFQFIECFFHDGGSTFFPIKEGSHLTITYKGDHQIEFAGADKAEIEFYNSSKEINRSFMNASFFFPAESDFEDYSLFIEKHYSALSNILDSLTTENVMSPKFSNILKNNFNILIICVATGMYRTRYLENGPTKVNGQDSIKVENKINEILDRITPVIDSGDIFKYSSGRSALAIYYTNRYRHLEEKDKKELFSKNSWAKYQSPNKLGYLIAPEEIQYKLLTLELLENYENAVTRGDSTFINHITSIRPENAFLPYILKKRNELLESMNADISGVKYIDNTIDALEDLSKVEAFNQKLLYVDLWATWCGPCIEEFKHRDKLHELLSNYKDIIPVYISIDEDSNDTLWKEKTKAFVLNGYHLRANKKLVTYINEKLYEGKGIGVPRYILLGKDGNILEKNLTHPSNIDILKPELDKHF